MKKIRIILVLIFLLGVFVRIIAAKNLGVSADDVQYAAHAIDIIKGNILQTYAHPPLWYYLTDISYNVLGVTQLGSRLVGILFGSLTILLTYLISRFFFSKKWSLIPAFLVAISPMLITHGSMAEMDVPMLFFILFSQYFLLKYLSKPQKKYFLFSAILFGIALLFKYIALVFLPSFLIIYYIYSKKEDRDFKLFTLRNLKLAFFFVLIIFVFFLPSLTYNHLLYKDKGYLDFQFARFTGKSEEIYKGLGGIEETFDFKRALGIGDYSPGLLQGITFYLYEDFAIFLLGIIGLIISLFNKRKLFHLCWPSLLFPFLFLTEASIMSKHFVFAIPYFSFLATNAIITIKKKIKIRGIILLILVFVLITSAVHLKNFDVFSKSPISKFIEYKEENLPKNSFFIADSRIYRGRIVWMLNDMLYLEAIQATKSLNNLDEIEGEYEIVQVYFLECGSYDCGWGTIEKGGDLDENMRSFFSEVKKGSEKIKDFKDKEGSTVYTLHSAQIQSKRELVPLIKSTHVWFFNPVRYENMENFIFNYKTHSVFDKLLDKLAHFVLWIAVFLALLAIPILFLTLKKETNKND